MLVTSPEAFLRRFASERPLRVALEAGTHSPWASRMLQGCGHEVLESKPKTDRIDALGIWLAWYVLTRSSCTHSSIGAKTPKPIWPSSARVRRWGVPAHSL
jgi:hypothetical protein